MLALIAVIGLELFGAPAKPSIVPPIGSAIVASSLCPVGGASTNWVGGTNAGFFTTNQVTVNAVYASQYSSTNQASLVRSLYTGQNIFTNGCVLWSGYTESAKLISQYSGYGVVDSVLMTLVTNTITYSQPLGYTNPAVLPSVVWTNYLAFRTNKTTSIWLAGNWPVRDTNCIIYGMDGFTSFTTQVYNGTGGTTNGQNGVPTTLITRRVVYSRGHSGGDTGGAITNTHWGTQILFTDISNNVYVATVTNHVGYTGTNGDFCLSLLTADVPANIQTTVLMDATNLFTYYTATNGTSQLYQFNGLYAVSSKYTGDQGHVVSVFQNNYGGTQSTDTSGGVVNYDSLTYTAMTGGDSGSPNWIPIPINGVTTLVMPAGRTTTAIDSVYAPLFLPTLYQLEASVGLDTNNAAYQPRIFSPTNYPPLGL